MERTTQRRGLLRTYLPLIVVVTLATVSGALLALLLRPAHYVSTADVEVRAESIGSGTPVAPNMGTELQIARSGDVSAIAEARLKLTPGSAVAGLSVSALVDTTVLEFSYSASQPGVAHNRAAAFANAYVDYRNQQSNAPPAPRVALIISQPTLPTAPSKPNYPLLLGLSLIIGVMLGIGCAFVWDRLSGRLRGIDDVESQTGLPVLTSVPALKSDPVQSLAALAKHPVAGAEAFGYLTARVRHLLEAREASSLLITSPSKGAGKTTVAVNLGRSLAATGMRTILVSVDTRSPKLHECFGADPAPGLSDVLRGTATLAQAMRTTEVPGLQVLPTGSAGGDGDLIFNLEDLCLLLGRLSATGAMVILDAPAVLGNPETALLANKVDAVLLVVDVRRGSRADAVSAVSLLSDIGEALVGVVSNDPGRRRQRRSKAPPVIERPAKPSESPIASESKSASAPRRRIT